MSTLGARYYRFLPADEEVSYGSDEEVTAFFQRASEGQQVVLFDKYFVIDNRYAPVEAKKGVVCRSEDREKEIIVCDAHVELGFERLSILIESADEWNAACQYYDDVTDLAIRFAHMNRDLEEIPLTFPPNLVRVYLEEATGEDIENLPSSISEIYVSFHKSVVGTVDLSKFGELSQFHNLSMNYNVDAIMPTQ